MPIKLHLMNPKQSLQFECSIHEMFRLYTNYQNSNHNKRTDKCG